MYLVTKPVDEPIAFCLKLGPLGTQLVEMALETRHIARRLPGVGPVDRVIGNSCIPLCIVVEMQVIVQFLQREMLCPVQGFDFITQLE